ncbi:MAG: hypothetical protein JW984_05865 [Deltaproteobacteria bacterium]|uniref:Tetratricopeptide repeat protein n=1 Tax=Candidatus Zymogenus saltonus TaxID=2844893 RepID=A0A9D8KDK2_9DELT|nr:hypothetical protein [Candidatus Zymogenus saltonus]
MKIEAIKIRAKIAARSSLAYILLALFLITTVLFIPGVSSASENLYISDILDGAEPNPAFKNDHYKTRRDVLSGVVGPETWVEHYVRGDETIETLSYNNYIYGIIVKKDSGKIDHYNLNDDKKTYSLSGEKPPEGWLSKGPDYNEVVRKANGYISDRHYKDAIELIEGSIDEREDKTGNLYFLLALAYDGMNEVEYAAQNYKKAVDLNLEKNELTVALRNLGIILRGLGRHNEAAVYLERYLDLVPNDPDAENIKKYVSDYK